MASASCLFRPCEWCQTVDGCWSGCADIHTSASSSSSISRSCVPHLVCVRLSRSKRRLRKGGGVAARLRKRVRGKSGERGRGWERVAVEGVVAVAGFLSPQLVRLFVGQLSLRLAADRSKQNVNQRHTYAAPYARCNTLDRRHGHKHADQGTDAGSEAYRQVRAQPC